VPRAHDNCGSSNTPPSEISRSHERTRFDWPDHQRGGLCISQTIPTLKQREELGWVARAPAWEELITEVEMTIAADREQAANQPTQTGNVGSVDRATLSARLQALTPEQRMQPLDTIDREHQSRGT
jgi:hypothetical protein